MPPPRLHVVPSEASAAATEGARSDDVLMALAAEDRTAAFVELVARYEGKLRAFCGLLVKNDALGRDLAQEVFLKLWSTRDRYRSQGKFRELLFTIARNECRSALRKRRLRRLLGFDDEAELADDAPVDAPRADDALQDEERRIVIRRALESLPEKFRVPLTLRFCEELPYDEIAAVIGKNESTTRSRIFYGLKALEAVLPAEALS